MDVSVYDKDNQEIEASGIVVLGSNCTVRGDRNYIGGSECVVYGNDNVICANNCTVNGYDNIVRITRLNQKPEDDQAAVRRLIELQKLRMEVRRLEIWHRENALEGKNEF